jgi:hypothetical protein
MAKSRFESFPPCCQKILDLLERERREGARNCEKGHLVSLDYAAQIERQSAAKRVKEAEAAAARPPEVDAEKKLAQAADPQP